MSIEGKIRYCAPPQKPKEDKKTTSFDPAVVNFNWSAFNGNESLEKKV